MLPRAAAKLVRCRFYLTLWEVVGVWSYVVIAANGSDCGYAGLKRGETTVPPPWWDQDPLRGRPVAALVRCSNVFGPSLALRVQFVAI